MRLSMKQLKSTLLLLVLPFSTMASPEKGPGYYELLNGATDPVTIPFTMHNGKPLLEVEINGKPAKLMIDNGVLWDQVWLFGSPLVEALELKPEEEGTIEGAGDGDPTAAYTSENLTLEFEDIIFLEQPVIVSPKAAGFAGMFPGTDGQLCNTFFKHFIVEFDFVRNEVLLHDPKQFKYSRRGSVLDLQLDPSGTHSVPFSFEMNDGKTYEGRVDVDFGGIHALKIALNNRHQLPLPDNVNETRSFGAQGESHEYFGYIRSMTIGPYTFQHPMAWFGDGKTSRIHPDNLGVIGLPLFMKFDITFDYLNNKIYLEPNAHFGEPFS